MIKYNVQKRINYINSLKILDSNKRHIINFTEDQAARGNSKARQVKYISTLGKIAEIIDYDFKKATKQDIKNICSKINNSNLAEWTKHDYLAALKIFYKFLYDTEEPPEIVKWIKPNKVKNHKKLPRELLTIEDTNAIADNTNNPRDRCLVLMLYETGARISELLGLKIKDLEFEEKYARVTLPDNGKTGPRKILIVASTPAILNWLKHHPRKDDKNAFLICGLDYRNKGLELNYRHVNQLLREAGKKAGVDKPMNPHHFRHSRATELACKLTEAQLCKYMGWVIGSKEAATYVHLSGRDTDNAILEIYGLARTENKEVERFKPIECPRCSIINDPAAKFCNGCGLGLDEKSIMEYDKKKELATKTGFGYLQSSEKTQDAINQAVLNEIRVLREKVESLEK
jgi:site-specific recombinase XerD